jgi:hypothetical protein
MNQREKLKVIKGLISGFIKPEEIKSEVQIWMQEIGKELFRNIKSEETLTRKELDEYLLTSRNKSRIIIVEFVKGKTIL